MNCFDLVTFNHRIAERDAARERLAKVRNANARAKGEDHTEWARYEIDCEAQLAELERDVIDWPRACQLNPMAL